MGNSLTSSNESAFKVNFKSVVINLMVFALFVPYNMNKINI